MTTSEWKCRLFYKANQFESIHITNRIDSIRIANWNALLHNTHQPTLTLEFHNFELFKSCRTSSFCTVAWQLARFQLTRRIARSLGDSWASCLDGRQCRISFPWVDTGQHVVLHANTSQYYDITPLGPTCWSVCLRLYLTDDWRITSLRRTACAMPLWDGVSNYSLCGGKHRQPRILKA